MTDIDSMIAVLQSAKDGKVIQKRSIFKGHDPFSWRDPEDTEGWDFTAYEFRVKPEPEVVGFYAWKASDGYVVHKMKNPNLELEFIDGKLVGAKVL